ncbi:hypothetical protein AGMMS49959_10450 [Planctomycetales bacterium]|nr:hypothetical protein AGMMS49959_10450 [Planctomycetales bacterium]
MSAFGGEEEFYLGYPVAQVKKWRADVSARREAYFRRHWKNPRNIPPLTPLEKLWNLDFLRDWYKEAGDLANQQQNIRFYGKQWKNSVAPVAASNAVVV